MGGCKTLKKTGLGFLLRLQKNLKKTCEGFFKLSTWPLARGGLKFGTIQFLAAHTSHLPMANPYLADMQEHITLGDGTPSNPYLQTDPIDDNDNMSDDSDYESMPGLAGPDGEDSESNSSGEDSEGDVLGNEMPSGSFCFHPKGPPVASTPTFAAKVLESGLFPKKALGAPLGFGGDLWLT